MDVKTAPSILKNNLYIIKTINDLTFHFSSGEIVTIMDSSTEIQIPIEKLENKKLPFYIIDPGNDLVYSVYYFKKI